MAKRLALQESQKCDAFAMKAIGEMKELMRVESGAARGVDRCASSQCLATMMLKQRIRFEALSDESQVRMVDELAKRAVDARTTSNARGAACVLCFAIAWLQAPVKRTAKRSAGPSSSPNQSASNDMLRSIVADLLAFPEIRSDTTSDLLVPALAIIQEIMQSSNVNLHEAVGSSDWLKIEYHLTVHQHRAGRGAACQPAQQSACSSQPEFAAMTVSVACANRKIAEFLAAASGDKEDTFDVPAPKKRGRPGRQSRQNSGAQDGIRKQPSKRKLLLEDAAGQRQNAGPGGDNLVKADAGVRVRQCKQSGVPNVNWVDTLECWKVKYRAPETGTTKSKEFRVRRYMETHGSYKQADVAALKDAIAFRASLVAQGVLKKVTRCRSSVPGVTWNEATSRWSAQIQARGESRKLYFPPKGRLAKDIKLARLDAEKQRKKWEIEYGMVPAGLKRLKHHCD